MICLASLLANHVKGVLLLGLAGIGGVGVVVVEEAAGVPLWRVAVWEDVDPARVDFGDGSAPSMQVSVMEFFRLMVVLASYLFVITIIVCL